MSMPVMMVSAALFPTYSHVNLQPAGRSLLLALPMFWMVAALMLAGAGIRTEAPFRARKGLHGSMYFTLSLPVSRLRLLAERALSGMPASAVVVTAMCVGAWTLLPGIRSQVGAADGTGYLCTILLCNTAIYGLATLYATFLDQQWQILATMATVFAWDWVFRQAHLPQSVDLHRAMGDLSPLVVHRIPWPSVGVAIGAAVVFFAAAARIVQTREY